MSDRTYLVSTATSPQSRAWVADAPSTWREITGRLPTFRCWLGGALTGPERSEATVAFRSLLTLDEDEPSNAWAVDADLTLGCAHLRHTTKSSTPAVPRYRLVVPLSRDLDADEYWLVASAVMDAVGWGRDRGGAEAERLMFGPPQDAAIVVVDGFPLDADAWLARALATGVQPRRAERAPTQAPADVCDRPTPEQLAKANAVLDKAVWEVEHLVDKDTGDKHAGRNDALIRWLPTLYRFALGGCLDEEKVDGRMLDAARAAPSAAGGPFSEGEFATVSRNAWGYATPQRPDVQVDFDPASPDTWPDVPDRLEDAHLAEWMAHRGLGGLWCWAGGLGWMHWDGRRWVPRADENVREAIRRAAIEANRTALDAGAGAVQMAALAKLLSVGRIGALAHLMRGVVAVDAGDFDQRPDLLNVGNGVVDLRTGEVGPHDPVLRLSKITETDYNPAAAHQDWDQALKALDPEVADWMQVRIGQAATGYPPDDDVLPIGQGGGSNGKSTLLAGLFVALGEHITQVPERLIRASPSDHPTELTTLRGARVAVIDETPEVADLNVQRIKAMLGTEFITARQIRKDNVTWRATHALLVMTNYRPRVNETDHGTWRRLALVRFDKKFLPNSRFRAAVARGGGGRREAALAWVVAGAMRWYAADRVMPAPPDRVQSDTVAWRAESDLVLGFITDHLVPESDCHVLTSDVLNELNSWLVDRGHRQWSSQLLTSRFEGHGIIKSRPSRQVRVSRPAIDRLAENPAKPWLFQGYRWSGTYLE